jgi:hypothetical protein
MTGVDFRPGSENMPGYLRSTRRISSKGSLRAAWNSLDLFSGKDAEDFLAEKLRHIANQPKDKIEAVALEVILGCMLLAVEAEREEQEALAAVDTTSPPDPRPSEAPREDIPW